MKRKLFKTVTIFTMIAMLFACCQTAFAAVSATDVGISIAENADGTLKVTPKATILNDNADATDKGVVIYAAYKGDEMVGVSYSEVDEIEKAGTGTVWSKEYKAYGDAVCNLSAMDSLPADTDTVKAFVWKDMTNAEPAVSALTYKVNDGYAIPAFAGYWGGEIVTDAERGDVTKATFNPSYTWGSYSRPSNLQFEACNYIAKNGSGTYVVECWIKPGVDGRTVKLCLAGGGEFSINGQSLYGTQDLITGTVKNEWIHIKKEFTIGLQSAASALSVHDYAKGAPFQNGAFYMTDVNGATTSQLTGADEYILVDDFKFYKKSDSTVSFDNNLLTLNQAATVVGGYSFEGGANPLLNPDTGAEIYGGDYHTGSYSLKLTPNSQADTAWWTGGFAKNLKPNTKYRLTFYMKQTKGVVGTDQYDIYLGPGTLRFTESYECRYVGREAKIGEWVKVTADCTTQATLSNGGRYFRILVQGTSATNGNEYLVDDFKLVEITE